ncbi:MAG: hypothetical protein V1844_09775 [Pseudomonadota bacterium]
MTIVADIWNMIEDNKKWQTLKETVERIPELEARITALEKRLSGGAAEYVCDHCGSPSLKRTGSRPDPTFGVVGVKQLIFLCEECRKESAFQEK